MSFDNYESKDSMHFFESSECLPSDTDTQTIVMQHNDFYSNKYYDGEFTHILMIFSEIPTDIFVTNNTFSLGNYFYYPNHQLSSIWPFWTDVAIDKTLIDIQFSAHGEVEVDYNTFYKCSSTQDLVVINTNQHITANGNIFDTCEEYGHSFFIIKESPNVEVHGMTIKNSTYHDLDLIPLVFISSSKHGHVLIEKCEFQDNYVGYSLIELDSSVGNMTIQHCSFIDETLSSSSHYLKFDNQFTLTMKNLTFTNVHDQHDLTSNALLIEIISVDLSYIGNITFDGLYSTNSPVGLLSFGSFNGVLEGDKYIFFNDIQVKDATFDTSSDLVIFGPYNTKYDVHIYMTNVVMKNLYFSKFANIIHLKQQGPHPFVFEHCNFTNINGGIILIEPVTIKSDSLTALVNFSDIRAHDNEFKFSTFIEIKEHVDVSIYDSQLYSNSAKFRGVILSIVEKGSSAHIYNTVINRNSGLYGGAISVDGNSHIDVVNCNFTGNFAVTSSIATIQNQGHITFDNWYFTDNSALSVGILDTFDSITASTFKHIEISNTKYVDKESIVHELENPQNWVYLCFASDDYIAYMLERQDLLDITVSTTIWWLILSSIIGILLMC